MTKDDVDKEVGADEPFLNETLAHSEISELFEPKVLVNAKLYDTEGEHKATNFDDNDNSVVFKIKVNNLNYLYTGDISTKVELDLINKYNNTLQSDILKVSHHGSSTSSHLNFINVVNPRYAIISSSLRNIYNLPNDNIIYLYKTMGVSLYETRYHGSIIFKESEILTFPP